MPIKRLLVLFCAIVWASALAQGRFSCRVDTWQEIVVRCFVEQTVFKLGNFEITSGVRSHNDLFSLYSGVLWYERWGYMNLEIMRPLDGGRPWGFGLAFGMSW